MPQHGTDHESHAERRGLSRRALVGGVAATGLAGATKVLAQNSATPVATPVGSPAVSIAPRVLVFPRPNSEAASARTQITFRAPGLTTLGPVEVTGEQSGVH